MNRETRDNPVTRLVQAGWLDPREAPAAAAAPIPGVVNIPFSELPRRVAELPPTDVEIGVVGPVDLAREVIAWLEARGRRGAYVAETPDSAATAIADSEVRRLWRPNPFLEEVSPSLAPGRALDLACGMGREAVCLAARGWDVTAVDVLPDALERAAAFADRYRSIIRPIRWLECDLEKTLPAAEGGFDLISIFRYLYRPLFAEVSKLLRPGGSVVCETFTTLHRERHGRPSRPADVLRLGELPTLLPGFNIRHYSEEWRGTAHTARLWAMLPLDS